ncbi:MAG: glycosyltransferase family 2 protein, partial [Lachnospiraceae bacterium]|nr:glycosyltransferase family 2 protein [Lachnospiraceae bacterium]
MAISIIKGYLIFVIVIMLVYAIRHFIFAVNRFQGRQRMYYGDIYTSKMKRISVLVPMHNEEQVLDEALKALLNCDYDRDMLEIIPINDNSTDRTKEMLDDYHRRYEFIRPLHRDCPDRGKPVGLNEAMQLAEGEIIVVFDADYRPARNLLKQLVIAFEDPEVGAVMGRV